MSFEQLLSNLNPHIVASLRRAIELGKWPNGVVITPEQRRLCGEAVANWEARNLPKEQQVGYVTPKASEEPCASKKDDEQPLNWV
ncbi:YeaC family protein [Microbulbifer sp. VTAC004]|uniref:YeaC family protein n=1 Tax=Microbulbifer sp. VTAC004 TaxID=3243386 RepID=UPI004039B79B